MRRSVLLVSLLSASLVMAGCASTEYSNTTKGAAIGAVVGAVAGKATGNHKDKRLVIGAAVGALAGAAVGKLDGVIAERFDLRIHIARAGVDEDRHGADAGNRARHRGQGDGAGLHHAGCQRGLKREVGFARRADFARQPQFGQVEQAQFRRDCGPARRVGRKGESHRLARRQRRHTRHSPGTP